MIGIQVPLFLDDTTATGGADTGDGPAAGVVTAESVVEASIASSRSLNPTR
jgi:hypothetical protein